MSSVQPKKFPAVGDTVHFHRTGAPVGEPLLARVVEVGPSSDEAPGALSLSVADGDTVYPEIACYSESPQPGRWTYPRRPYAPPAIMEKRAAEDSAEIEALKARLEQERQKAESLEAKLAAIEAQSREPMATLANEKPTIPPPPSEGGSNAG